MQTVRLAIVGSGQISDRFIKQALELEGVEFVATCARHLDSAKAKAELYGISKWYDDYRSMMDTEQLDGIIVATPHSVHAEVALAAFERRLNVLVEKPMATSLEDALAMVDAAKKNRCIFMSLPFDLYPNILTAINYLTEEYLGKFTGAEAQLSLPGPPRDNWYYDRKISHGGAVLDCLVYPVSRLVTLLGPVKSVTAMVNNIIPNRIVGGGARIRSDVDDNATLILEYRTGQHAVVRTLWGMALVQNNTIVYGRKGTVILGDSGYPLLVHSPERPIEGAKEVKWRGVDKCYEPVLSKFNVGNDIVGHFVNCVRTGETPKCSGELQLHVHEIMFGAYESAATGRTYDLTTSFDPWNKLPESFYDTRSAFI